ncbi:prenyltransferase alpha subunit, putative [Trichomonas vaginalis G3]|uniref:Geranylgeranyl transferase type-2 subunit alpha n=1 Tax=Trichomonas vaginalis (strain ATCC PRA-98 / G3) TaxID=412133 RepID=A2EZD7_TRIV3|nr:protein geranylgeranylation [Trichomonas vaginalis G3]EAY01958.1 prenyltransferase alpha subunit, putative [Trichomonas vaginalis G3]KAI5523036.1 protein geranylgeranylation [Trichomonas vaginalis G3]|eukprot:XP_001314468.1 prenyltransferase alpha subunit [Trichomonas vaginalis G3]
MHGRKKVPLDEAKKLEQKKAIAYIREEYEKVMDAQAHPEKINEVVESKTPILTRLDDFATCWNMRKKYFKEHATKEQLDIELEISENVIRSNPKSYWAFHHRRWCFEYMNITELDHEIQLCTLLLNADFRNFHAWRHRRWAVKRMGNKYEEELQNSYDFIQKDFSNYSAWHYRSQLPNLTDFKAELDIVQTCIYMDANDQSAWIYLRWLLNHEEIYNDAETLEQLESSIEELQEMEPNAKYVLLAQIWVLQKMKEVDQEKIAKITDKLVQLDPIRAPYYREITHTN